MQERFEWPEEYEGRSNSDYNFDIKGYSYGIKISSSFSIAHYNHLLSIN